MNFKEIFGRHIITAPDTIQFAKDRKYEEAWIIPRGDSPPTSADIEKYLDEPCDQLIVEYMWNSDDCENVFIMTIFNDNKNDLIHKKEFINTTLKLFYGYTDFKNFIAKYDSNVIGKEYLFNQPIEDINISVFNHWLSVGPETLYLSNETYSPEITRAKLEERPDILVSKKNFQSLLFRVNFNGTFKGPAYGLKTPISNKADNTWTVDIERLLNWIELFTS